MRATMQPVNRRARVWPCMREKPLKAIAKARPAIAGRRALVQTFKGYASIGRVRGAKRQCSGGVRFY